MKQYRLLKDLPGLKKGAILSEGKSLFGARTLSGMTQAKSFATQPQRTLKNQY